MKILVTGGAGFIGSNFINYIMNKYQDEQIVCVDLLTYAGDLNSLCNVINSKNFKFYKEDISNKKAIFNIFEIEKPDIVVNFAAESHVDRSIENSNSFIQTNVLGTCTLLDACVKYGIKRFHQVSTDEVYGDVELDDYETFYNEESILKPSSPYSSSKASADLFVESYGRTFNVPYTISRCTNNYGIYQHTEKLIPCTIKKALNNEKISVYGNGLNVRDWINVDEHCKAIDLIIHSDKYFEIYNVGTNNKITNLELVKIILNILNKDENNIEFVKDRKGHDLKYSIDTSKIEKELGFKSNSNFKNDIEKVVKWYVNNNYWLNR